MAEKVCKIHSTSRYILDCQKSCWGPLSRSKPGVSRLEVSNPEVTVSEVDNPVETMPDVAKPEVTVPEVANPEVNDPDMLIWGSSHFSWLRSMPLDLLTTDDVIRKMFPAARWMESTAVKIFCRTLAPTWPPLPSSLDLFRKIFFLVFDWRLAL